MGSQIGAMFGVLLVLTLFYSPIFMLCVHFALKKNGGLIVGYSKKIALGLLASLIWLICLFIAAQYWSRGGIFSQLSTYETVLNLLLGLAFFITVPNAAFAFALEHIGPKWSSEDREKKYWRRVARSTSIRFGVVLGILLSLASMLRDLV